MKHTASVRFYPLEEALTIACVVHLLQTQIDALPGLALLHSLLFVAQSSSLAEAQMHNAQEPFRASSSKDDVTTDPSTSDSNRRGELTLQDRDSSLGSVEVALTAPPVLSERSTSHGVFSALLFR